MHSEDFVLAIISALRDRKIKGKKRLQKIAFFLKAAGAKCDAYFDIRDYGPFSREIASAAQSLTLKGRIEETEEPIGASGTFVTVYKIRVSDGTVKPLAEKYKQILIRLDGYPTVDLEVAATFEFFKSTGLSADAARKKTVELKPTKAKAQVLRNINKIIEAVHAG